MKVNEEVGVEVKGGRLGWGRRVRKLWVRASDCHGLCPQGIYHSRVNY